MFKVDADSRVLVTGSSGFIGTNFVMGLKKIGVKKIIGLDIISPRNPENNDIHCSVDLCDVRRLHDVVVGFAPTHIMHLGARTDLLGVHVNDYAANTDGVRNLISAVKALDELPRRIAFASSRLVCNIGYVPSNEDDFCPSTPYGVSKVVGEKIVRTQCEGLNWVVFRPTSIWGPWFQVPYRNFFDSVRSGRYLHPSGRSIWKSFGYVGNSVHQLMGLLFAESEFVVGRTFYLCDYQPLEVGAWADRIGIAFGRGPAPRVPVASLTVAAKLGDFLEFSTGKRVQAPLTSFRLNNLLTEMVLPDWGLSEVVADLPCDFATGVDLTVDWIRGINKNYV